MKTYWITKYALIRGVLKIRANKPSKAFPEKIFVFSHGELYNKPYWHETEKEAASHSEDIKRRKIAHHKLQIMKLEELFFPYKIKKEEKYESL